MSERGSFVVQYLYCKKCADVVQEVLLKKAEEQGKYLVPFTSQQYQNRVLAGKVGGVYAGQELELFDEMRDEIEAAICHPVRIAVLPEWKQGDAILAFNPRPPKEN